MTFILSVYIFFICLAVILLVPCVIPFWDSVAVHLPSGKGLNSSSQEDARFSGHCSMGYDFLLHPASSLLGTQQQLTHPPGKELDPSSFNQSCFSGLIVMWCSHIILTGLSLFWCSTTLIIKPYMKLYYFILSAVYF